jgi:O-antigen ligase
MKVVQEHPWTGIGYGRESLRKAYPKQALVNEEWWHTFNVFLGIATGLGLPGLFLFLWMLFVFARQMWQCRELSDPILRFFGVSVLVVILGSLLRNWFDDIYTDGPALLFWVLIAMVIASKQSNKEELTIQLTREPLVLSPERR